MKFMNAPDVCQNFISTLFDDKLLTFDHSGRYYLVELNFQLHRVNSSY